MSGLYQQKPRRNRGNQKPVALWIQQHLHPPLPSREGCIYSTESIALSLRLCPFVSLFWGILLRRWGRAYSESQFFLALGFGRSALYSTQRNTVSSESKICADWSWSVRREFFLWSLRRNPHQSHMLSQGLLRQGWDHSLFVAASSAACIHKTKEKLLALKAL